MTTQLAVCEPRAGAHAEPALRPGVEEPLRGGWRRATLRDAQGSRGRRGPTGAAGRGPKRAAEANGQVRRHVDAAARPVVGAEPVLCANRRPLAERSSTRRARHWRGSCRTAARCLGRPRRRFQNCWTAPRGTAGQKHAEVMLPQRARLRRRETPACEDKGFLIELSRDGHKCRCRLGFRSRGRPFLLVRRAPPTHGQPREAGGL